ncbi:MAG: DMT family transporter [Myxococcales bacterium]|nr:DMT family transporter [Myxococcales bacterium]
MALAALFFSTMSLFVKLGGHHLPLAELVFARSVVALAIAGFSLHRLGLGFWGENRRLLLLRGVLGFSALICYFFAITRLPLADATVLQFTNPIFTALLATLILGERMSGRDLTSALVSLLGVIVVARPSFLFGAQRAPLDLLAVMVALLGALCSAAAYTTVRKLRETDHPMVVVWYFPLVSTPLIAPIAAVDWVWPVGWDWLVLLAIGTLAQLGQVYMTRSLHLETAARATAVSYLQIVFAIVWGLLAFSEVPSPMTLVGATLVVLGTLGLAKRRVPASEKAT